MIEKVKLVLATAKHLKPVQIKYQFLYRLQRVKTFIEYQHLSLESTKVNTLKFTQNVPVYKSYLGETSFSFLNIPLDFGGKIDWDFQKFGKLWNYNLQYVHYILQGDVPTQKKVDLLQGLYSDLEAGVLSLEPYPVSLRSINVIRFICEENVEDSYILQSLYTELSFLFNRLEFHILGNHLLENAFALCLGGAFFNNHQWRDKAMKILNKELDEQMLADGAHFELSPMYHNIIFFRVLELIDWYRTYEYRDNEFLSFCSDIASKMYSWLENIQFTNGDIPLFNDAAKGIAYDSKFLIDYANTLCIRSANMPMGQSGYRSYANDNYEIKMDLAQIGASYQPGHAHADALSFILYYQGKPLLVEQGTSTYQIGERRNLERSTEAHNTVVVNGRNQSEVWGGFRVGKRAKTTIHQETSNSVEASHDGYKGFGVIHNRQFLFQETQIQIKDTLTKSVDAKVYLHLHPNRRISKTDNNHFVIDDYIVLLIDEARSISLEEYEYAESYNQYKRASRLVISFDKELSTTILFEQLR